MGNRECCTSCINGTNLMVEKAGKKMLPKEQYWMGGELATS